MTVRKLVLAVLFISATFGLTAQDAAAPAGGAYRSFTPADQWELGVHAGLPFVLGDLDSKIGFGGGLHVRKSLDHIFSIRVSALYAQTSNENADVTPKSTADMTWFSGSAQLVATVNNFRFNKPYRKIALNVFAGLGINKFETEYENIGSPDPMSNTWDNDVTGSLDVGVGLGYRINPKFNIGLEYQVTSVLGSGADYLDGDNNRNSNGTTFRDFRVRPDRYRRRRHHRHDRPGKRKPRRCPCRH